jgi:hypothetical protein
MADYSAGAQSQSMLAIDFNDLAGGTITSSGATEIDVTGASGAVYKIIGTGFTSFDASGFPTDGTISTFEIGHGGGAPAIFSGLSMAGSDFTGFVEGDDLAGFEASALAGNDHIKGYKGDDVLVGGDGNNIFKLNAGGDDTATGGSGKDYFYFAGTFDANDRIDGGGGSSDRVILDGDYPSLTLGASTLTGIEYLVLTNGHSYDITTVDGNVAAGASLSVQAQTLSSTHTLHFDGSAETDGSFHVTGGKGADVLIGGAGNDVLSGRDGNDTLDVSQGGHDIASGGNGDDTIDAGGAFTKFERFNGGGGNDTLNIDGTYASTIKIASLQIVSTENIVFGAGHDYTVQLQTQHATDLVNIDASALGASDHFNFSFDVPDSTAVELLGGAGDDVINTFDGTITTYDLTRGGEDSVTLSGSTGTVLFGASFDAGDTVIEIGARPFAGSAVSLNGDYSAGVTMTATTLQNVQAFTMAAGHDYNLTFGADAGASVLFVTDTATATDHITLDTTALTPAAKITITNAAILDITLGGSGGFAAINGASSGTIDDTTGANSVVVNGTSFNSDLVMTSDGGTMVFNVTHVDAAFTDTTMQGFGTLHLNVDTDVTLVDGNIAAGHVLNVTGSGSLDASAETDGSLNATIDGGHIIGGALSDHLAGATHSDFFTGGGGQDFITCAKATDTLIYNGVSDSTSTAYDVITGFDASHDVFQLQGVAADPTAIDTEITGTINAATFDADMASVLGSSQLAAHHAVLLNVNGGDQNGKLFLVIDENGTAGYQGGQDYVMQIFNPKDIVDLSTDNFS